MDLARYDGASHVDILQWPAPGLTKPSFEEAIQGLKSDKASKIEKGFRFGPAWSNHWLKVVLTIPEAARNAKEIICKLTT